MISDDSLRLAEQAIQTKDYSSAMRHCDDHLSLSPLDKSGLRLKAHIFALSRDFNSAVRTLDEVINLSGDKPEPHDFFSRGRGKLSRRNFTDATFDFSEAIRLCSVYADDYYLESAFLHRAICFIHLMAHAKARDDLVHVGDECRTYILGKLYSKPELLSHLTE